MTLAGAAARRRPHPLRALLLRADRAVLAVAVRAAVAALERTVRRRSRRLHARAAVDTRVEGE